MKFRDIIEKKYNPVENDPKKKEGDKGLFD